MAPIARSRNRFGQPAQGLGQSRASRHQPEMKLGTQQPAHLECLVELGPRSQLSRGVAGHPLSIRGTGFLIAQAGENRAPGAAIAQDRVVAQPADGNHDVGVGDVPVEIDPPALIRGRQVGKPALVRGIVELKRDALRQLVGQTGPVGRRGHDRHIAGLDSGLVQQVNHDPQYGRDPAQR